MSYHSDTIKRSILELEESYRTERKYVTCAAEDNALCDEFKRRKYLLEKELHMNQNDLSNAAMGSMLGAGQGAMGIGSGLGLQNVFSQGVATAQKAAFLPEPGVVYRDNNTELQEDWRGAKYETIERTLNTAMWQFKFKSKWSTTTLHTYVDAEKYNGQEANKIAQTVLETINQRRLG